MYDWSTLAMSCQCICICKGLSLTSIYKIIICVKDFVILAAWLELAFLYKKKKKLSLLGMVCFLKVCGCKIQLDCDLIASNGS